MTRIILFTICILSFAPILKAQVGVGTDDPQTDLHVAGDLLVQTEFVIGELNTVSATEEDFKLLTRDRTSVPVGELKTLDVTAINVAPVNTIDYHFTNISLDNLADVDLQYDADDYIVGIANFRYVGDAIKKVDIGGTDKSIGQFVTRTFISGGKWHLEIQNRSLDLDPTDSLEYYVTLIIYDKSYYKNLTPIVTDLGGSNTGTASSVPSIN